MKTYEELIAGLIKRHSAVCKEGDRVTIKSCVARSIQARMDERVISGFITTANLGIDGMFVPGEAFDRSYFNPETGVKSVYYNHDYDLLPIGKCATLQAQDHGLWCRTWLDTGDFASDVLRMVENECIGGFSSGFRIRDAGDPSEHERRMWNTGGEDMCFVRDALLLEYSVVAMPGDGFSRIDQLVTRGVIRRDSAAKVGAPITAKRTLFPTVEVVQAFADVVA